MCCITCKCKASNVKLFLPLFSLLKIFGFQRFLVSDVWILDCQPVYGNFHMKFIIRTVSFTQLEKNSSLLDNCQLIVLIHRESVCVCLRAHVYIYIHVHVCAPMYMNMYDCWYFYICICV